METESQILGALVDIRRLLQLLVWLGAIIAVAVSIRAVTNLYVTWRQVRSEGFEALVLPHYRSGRFDRVVEICREKIEEEPDNPYAHWFLGLVSLDRGNSEAARTHFERVLHLVPSWRPTVEPYLNKASGQPVSR